MIVDTGEPVTAAVHRLSQNKYFTILRNRCEIQQRAIACAAILLLNSLYAYILVVDFKHIYFMNH